MIDRFISLVDGWKLLAIVVLFGLDFLAAVILAIKNKQFAWNKLPQFLKTDFLYMGGGYLIVGIAATVEPSLELIVPATWGLLIVGLLAGLLNKLKALGVPVPDEPVK